MKRVLTALGNPALNNELRRYEKYDVIEEDLFYQDAVVDVLEEESVDAIVVSGLLQGQDDFCDFIGRIKRKNSVARIIVITDEMDTETQRLLANMGVYDILYDCDVEISDVIDAIDREEPIARQLVRETVDNSYDKAESEIKVSYITKVQKQEVIAISGTNGSGKSTFAVNLAKKLSQKSDAKILLIDLDTLNGNIDEIMHINKVPQNVDLLMDEDKKCGLNYAVDLIAKNRFDTNVLDELVVSEKGVDVLTGNVSLHYCQNVLKEEYYQKILSAAKEKYDFIIFDTSSNIFLDSTKWALQEANRVLFVTENSYICLKKSTQLLNVFLNVWRVWKEKIQLVVRKSEANGIEVELIEKILENMKLAGVIKNNDDAEYERILANIHFIPKQSFAEKIEMIRGLIKNKVGKENAVLKEVPNAN
ncbi:MAG: AAA family ATPase [Clostridia bacterium]|nr:AAA family ATPase [Clostridia bacterium]